MHAAPIEGEHLLIGAVGDGLGEVDQLLPADNGEQGGILQQDDEFIAQGGQNGLEWPGG